MRYDLSLGHHCRLLCQAIDGQSASRQSTGAQLRREAGRQPVLGEQHLYLRIRQHERQTLPAGRRDRGAHTLRQP